MSAVRRDARHRPRQPEVRRQGLTRNLPGEAVGRIFGLAFALEQVRHTLEDLADRARERARPGGQERPTARESFLASMRLLASGCTRLRARPSRRFLAAT